MNAPFDKKFYQKQFSSITNYPLNLWRKSLDINLTGALLIAQTVIKYFEQKKKGHLINIGSNYGLVAPDQSIYKEKEAKFLQTSWLHSFQIWYNRFK